MQVIELKGSGTDNGYMLGSWSGKKAWKNTMGTKMMWGSRFNEYFVVYISLQTKKGHRYLYYTPTDTDLGINSSKTYIHHALGSTAKDGTWRGFERDLETDLKEFEPDNTIVSVNAFLVRGSGYVSEVVIHDENYAKMITVSNDGNTIFTSNGQTVNLLRTNNLQERPLATFRTNGTIKDMILSSTGDKLIILHSDSLEVFDVSTPYAPQLLHHYPVDDGLSIAIDESDSKAFVASGKNGVMVVNINL